VSDVPRETPLPIGIDDVRRAADRLTGVAHRTPVVTSRALDDRVGGRVFLKAENLQRVGAFKFRGAYNAVTAHTERGPVRGVATVSSGNHGQALALAARLHDVPATVLMPTDAPVTKRAAVLGYGAHVVDYDRYADQRDELLDDLARRRGLVPVHPYDEPLVMAGQGTVALELLDQVGPLDLLLVCVGGGGLIAGCATVAAALQPGVRVVGVEPAAGDDVRQSLAAGRPVTISTPRTIADGQQTNAPGTRTFAVIARHVDEVVLATDAEIVDAMRFLFERTKLVVEPSGACALAALLAGRVDARGLRVGVTLSGGNVDVARFAALMTSDA
jgi:threonine dehydratase